ncbi:hypothetical protein ACI77O_12800 [Pseudomonas tritici]|uniref:hypothetical protein n=1 Tax=Pseudomonas tritici TaxID=2745518 RepID=UPI00387AEC2D
MKMASYSIQATTDLLVVITDDQVGTLPSLTNSAGEVVADLNAKIGGLGTRRVYYRDTAMRYDELLHSKGVFTGFATCKPAQQDFMRQLN